LIVVIPSCGVSSREEQRLTAASHPGINDESHQNGATSFDIHTKLDHISESIQSHFRGGCVWFERHSDFSGREDIPAAVVIDSQRPVFLFVLRLCVY